MPAVISVPAASGRLERGGGSFTLPLANIQPSRRRLSLSLALRSEKRAGPTSQAAAGKCGIRALRTRGSRPARRHPLLRARPPRQRQRQSRPARSRPRRSAELGARSARAAWSWPPRCRQRAAAPACGRGVGKAHKSCCHCTRPAAHLCMPGASSGHRRRPPTLPTPPLNLGLQAVQRLAQLRWHRHQRHRHSWYKRRSWPGCSCPPARRRRSCWRPKRCSSPAAKGCSRRASWSQLQAFSYHGARRPSR